MIGDEDLTVMQRIVKYKDAPPLEITIELTQYCTEDCDYCSTNATKDHDVYLSIDDFLDIVREVRNSGREVFRINISGGEPLSHPGFLSFKQYCDQWIGRENVYVYTNAISNLIYNTSVLKNGISVHANVVLIPGRPAHIPRKADVVHLLKLVKQGRAKELDIPDLKFHVSGNILDEECDKCNHLLIQADGKIMTAPCRKDYGDG